MNHEWYSQDWNIITIKPWYWLKVKLNKEDSVKMATKPWTFFLSPSAPFSWIKAHIEEVELDFGRKIEVLEVQKTLTHP